MLELGDAWLLADGGLKEPGDELSQTAGRSGRGGWVQTVEDEQIAVRVVHHGKGSDALEPVERGERFHFVVVDLVPCGVPAGVVCGDTDSEIHCSEVVADRG